MAKLDRPLYGEYASGTLARALSYRHTFNPPDAPGDPVVTWGTVAKIPVNSCLPSSGQVGRRYLFSLAVSAWHALAEAEQSTWRTSKPGNLSGFNFFVKLFLSPGYAYFGYCVFGSAWFQFAPGPDQPAAADYDELFPDVTDKFPTVRQGADSPQAWLYNRACSAIRSVQSYIIQHKVRIEI